MTLNRAARVLCVLLLLLGLTGMAQAQLPAYTLSNTAQQPMRFQTLDYARNSWNDHVINPGARKRYEFRSGDTVGKLRIATESRVIVEYEVRAGRAYAILWDAGAATWVIREQAPPAPPREDAPPANPPARPSFRLINTSGDPLRFQTFNAVRGTWKDQNIASGATMRFDVPESEVASRIRIATAGAGTVEYEVRAGLTYKLIWNSARQVWDLREAARP